MEEQEDEFMSFLQFLEGFNALTIDEKEPIEDDATSAVLRDTIAVVAKGEVDAEVIATSLQYLRQYKCPPVLAAAVSRAVLSDVTESDIEGCLRRSADGSCEGYDPIGLWKVVASKVKEVCKHWSKTSMDNLRSLTSAKESVSVCAVKNVRRKMEDRHVVIDDLNTLFGLKNEPPTRYYAVFDGHAGTDAASYAAVHLHYNIVHNSSYPEDITKAMREAFVKTDEDFIAKSNREGLKSGSTALCCLLRDKKLYVAWLGDSQAILVREGRAIELMVPHKPDRQDERERIESLGGCIVHFGTWRVNGTLAVSRAIGDVEYKPYVSSDADVIGIDLDGMEDFLVLACDGLWDFLQPDEAVLLVQSYLAEKPGDLDGVAARLVQAAKEHSSNDNITVVVVFLRDFEDYCHELSLPENRANLIDSALSQQQNIVGTNLDDPFSDQVTANGNPFGTQFKTDIFSERGDLSANEQSPFRNNEEILLQFSDGETRNDVTYVNHGFEAEWGTGTLRRNRENPTLIADFGDEQLVNGANCNNNPFESSLANNDVALHSQNVDHGHFVSESSKQSVYYEQYSTNEDTHVETQQHLVESRSEIDGCVRYEQGFMSSEVVPSDILATLQKMPIESTLSPDAAPFVMSGMSSAYVEDALLNYSLSNQEMPSLHPQVPTAPPAETSTPIEENLFLGDSDISKEVRFEEDVAEVVFGNNLVKELHNDESVVQEARFEVVAQAPHFEEDITKDRHFEEVAVQEPHFKEDVVQELHFEEDVAQEPHFEEDVAQEPHFEEDVAEERHNEVVAEDDSVELRQKEVVQEVFVEDLVLHVADADTNRRNSPSLIDVPSEAVVAVHPIGTASSPLVRTSSQPFDQTRMNLNNVLNVALAMSDDHEFLVSTGHLKQPDTLSLELSSEPLIMTEAEGKGSEMQDPVAIEKIPDNIPLAEDVEDDESEDGEEWKFYRTNAKKDEGIKVESEVQKEVEDVVQAEGIKDTLQATATIESQEVVVNEEAKSSSNILEVVSAKEVNEELVAILVSTASQPAKAAETSKPLAKAGPKSKVAPGKTGSAQPAAKPIPKGRSVAPSKPSAPSKSGTITKSVDIAAKKPSTTSAMAASRMTAAQASSKTTSTTRTLSSTTTTARKVATSSSTLAPRPKPTSAVATSSASTKASSTLTAARPSTRSVPPSTVTQRSSTLTAAKVSKDQVNVTTLRKTTSSVTTATSNVATTRRPLPSSTASRPLAKPPPPPKKETTTTTRTASATTKLDIKQTKETTNKQIVGNAKKAPTARTATNANGDRSPPKTSTSNGKTGTSMTNTLTPRSKSASVATTKSPTNNSPSSRAMSSTSPRTPNSKPLSTPRSATQKTPLSLARSAKTTPKAAATAVDTKKSKAGKIEDGLNEKGILDAAAKERAAHIENLEKNGGSDVNGEPNSDRNDKVDSSYENGECRPPTSNGHSHANLEAEEGLLML